MQELGEVIGAGGFGIVREIKGTPQIIKIMKSHVCETTAKKEYNAHKTIFETYSKFINNNPEFKNVIYIPEPIKFHECGNLNVCYGESDLACSYTMEKIESARPDKIQEHILLNGDYEDFLGMIVCVETNNYKVSNILNQDQRAICHPRGAFVTHEYIKERIGEELFNKLPYLFGILHGIVLKAGYAPVDVEMVLDKNNRIVMYDFGMVFENNANKKYLNGLALDMYVPSSENEDEAENFKEFEKGVAYVRENLSGGRRRRSRKHKSVSKKSRRSRRRATKRRRN